ncbi:unnamed protein product [Ceutorhynchus assimilis]|uniref:Uncharacterized protein n=1 Tax=Ceutorhynchus assimilis TaxID=467358 RepID=A0A9N9MWG9_9CUCU|nr:unnamed protein product [Ceutorhynchus assimilis]
MGRKKALQAKVVAERTAVVEAEKNVSASINHAEDVRPRVEASKAQLETLKAQLEKEQHELEHANQQVVLNKIELRVMTGRRDETEATISKEKEFFPNLWT